MSMQSSGSLRRLPLHSFHAEKGAKFGGFGDWEVPLYFTGILEEHEAVRTRAGLFDISHMGKFAFSGPQVTEFLNSFLPRNISAMAHGQALYMPLLNEKGGFVDDIIVYRISDDRYFMIVNASNVEKDYQWISALKPAGVQFNDLTSELGLISLQGPLSEAILERALGAKDFSALGYYRFKTWKDGMIARTGYTGEDGFEIMCSARELPSVWQSLFAAGKQDGILPIGFGARDTLRLEAAMPLYGHDMEDDTTPLELGIGWAIDWNKNSFTGRDILVAQKKEGAPRHLTGLEMIDRGIPRQGHEISHAGRIAGKVTSGSFSPTLKKNIALGYVAGPKLEAGHEVEIIIREKPLKAKVVKLPFYKRQK